MEKSHPVRSDRAILIGGMGRLPVCLSPGMLQSRTWCRRIQCASFAHGFAEAVDLVHVADQPVKDGIGRGWVLHGGAERCGRMRAGDDHQSVCVPVVQQFQQVRLLRSGEHAQVHVIQDESGGFRQSFWSRRPAALVTGFHQARQAMVHGSGALQACFARTGAGDAALAHGSWSGEKDELTPPHPPATGRMEHQPRILSATMASVSFRCSSLMTQFGACEAQRQGWRCAASKSAGSPWRSMTGSSQMSGISS